MGMLHNERVMASANVSSNDIWVVWVCMKEDQVKLDR